MGAAHDHTRTSTFVAVLRLFCRVATSKSARDVMAPPYPRRQIRPGHGRRLRFTATA